MFGGDLSSFEYDWLFDALCTHLAECRSWPMAGLQSREKFGLIVRSPKHGVQVVFLSVRPGGTAPPFLPGLPNILTRRAAQQLQD